VGPSRDITPPLLPQLPFCFDDTSRIKFSAYLDSESIGARDRDFGDVEFCFLEGTQMVPDLFAVAENRGAN